MVIQWKKYIFKINEFYGEHDHNTPVKKADVHAYFQQKQMTLDHPALTIHRQSFTLCINLHKTIEELRKDMNRTTRYQINKGHRDELKLKFIDAPTKKDIEEFAVFFNPFAHEKGIEGCRTDKLHALSKKNMLLITYVLNNKGKKLASHAYITNQKRATMFYSCSGRFENADIPGLNISRANRYLHWQDILYFKSLGFDIYDFMGLSTDPNNQAGANINKFKRGFGGEERHEYERLIPQNLKGKMLMLALKVLWRKKSNIIKINQLPSHSYKKTV